jgi:hypothetical protein
MGNIGESRDRLKYCMSFLETVGCVRASTRTSSLNLSADTLTSSSIGSVCGSQEEKISSHPPMPKIILNISRDGPFKDIV